MPSTALKGIFRSLRIYHGDKAQAQAKDQLYGKFLRPNDLAFDIGAHVGDRISSFRRLGARVVALEPQPLAFRALQLIHGTDSEVTLIQAVCGENDEPVTLRVNSANPTVSSASNEFITAANSAPNWQQENWDTALKVPSMTLERLLSQYGMPTFVKIDVEGYEALILSYLETRIPALSFEFTTIQRQIALDCIRYLQAIGDYKFNVSLGESCSMLYEQNQPAAQIRQLITQMDHSANSGDIYAVL